MRLGKNYFEEKKSSFLSIEKDLALIIKQIMQNQDLMKMLYYTQPDCLSAKNLSMKEIQGMLHKQIKLIPVIKVDPQCPNYIIITFSNFTPNATNPEFRDFDLNIDILCHPDHWNMGDFALRPYKIAGELDHMFKDKKLTGIGTTQFITGDNLLLYEDLIGFSLTYKVIHGIEDQIDPLS